MLIALLLVESPIVVDHYLEGMLGGQVNVYKTGETKEIEILWMWVAVCPVVVMAWVIYWSLLLLHSVKPLV